MTSRGRPCIGVALLLMAILLSSCTGSGDDADQVEPTRTEPFVVETMLASPNGQLRVEFGIDEFGRPSYRVIRSTAGNDETVIDDSTLGLELTVAGQPVSLSSGATSVQATDAQLVTDTFDLPTGKARQSSIDAQTQQVSFAGFDADLPLVVDVWVDDSAAALRYRVEASNASIRLEWERTSFALPDESEAWLQGHDQPAVVTPAYEQLRAGAVAADEPGRSPNGWTFPSLFRTGTSWTLITEADLGDWSAGSHLSPIVESGEYFIDLAARGEGNGLGDPRPVAQDEWRSPWRVMVTSTELGHIVESNHVRHLSTPAVGDFSWVRPGRVSWSWWSDHESSTNPDLMRPFIDLAADLGWEYSLIDANWNTFGDEELLSLIDYASERNVELFLWYNSGGDNNVVTEAPRDQMSDPTIRQAELAHLAELGIAGIKVDFFQSDKPVQIQQYRDIIRDAADVGLLTNFHGSTVPRGWSREFPNMMTMEAVRGAEIYTFDSRFAASAPRQNTILPFTRNVVGPMDYTPVILGNTVQRLTTNSHELALSVVFESPLQHFADTPEAYLSGPETVVSMLRDVPTVWDETKLLSGLPEEHVVIARRFGDEWWVGAINGTAEPFSASIDPSELGISPDREAVYVCDNLDWQGSPGSSADWDDERQYTIVTGLAQQTVLDMAANGGCLIRYPS